VIIVAGLTVIPIAVALWRYNNGRAGKAGSLAAGDNRGDGIEPGTIVITAQPTAAPLGRCRPLSVFRIHHLQERPVAHHVTRNIEPSWMRTKA
jgi:hypothetical protein